ncbi:MAG TPA: hypothetical protein VF331_28355 [Polyangiales bacterium]
MSVIDTLERVACAGLISACVIACGGSNKSSSGASPAPKCTFGTSYECWSAGPCTAHQLCLADGTGFTRCVCDDGTGTTGDAGGGQSADGGGAALTTDAASGGSVTHDAGREHDAATHLVDGSSHGVAEICDNGKDDDGNGKVDCADPACSSNQCVAGAPTGFSGPVALFVGSTKPPSCAAGFDMAAISGGTSAVGAPSTCSSCQCSAPSACASLLNFRTSDAGSCGGGSTCTSSVNATCAQITACPSGQATVSLEARPVGAQTGCTAPVQQPVTLPASWSVSAVACAAPHLGGGCQTSQVCAPHRPAAPFQTQLCVYQAGDVACPASVYTDKRLYDTKIEDTRSCSACTCNDTGTCSYSWKVFDSTDTSCQNPPTLTLNQGECGQVNPSSDKLRVGVSISGSPACSSVGGQPSGGVTESGPITVCCEP